MKGSVKKFLCTGMLLLAAGLFAQAPLVDFETITLSDQWGGGAYWVSDDGTMLGGGYYFGSGFLWTEEEGEVFVGGYYVRDMDNYGRLAGETTFPHDTDSTIIDIEAASYYEDGEWQWMGYINGTEPFDPYHYTGSWAIAADTFIIAGMYWHDNYRTTAFVWTPDNPLGTLLPDNGLDLSSRPNDMSNDGSIIVGWASTDVDGQYTDRAAHAWIWNESLGEYELVFLGSLADPPYMAGEAYCVSSDGELVGGWTWGELFIWNENDGMQGYGYAPGHDPMTAGVSAMGITPDTVVVGFAQPQTWVWTREAIMYTPETGIFFLRDSLLELGVTQLESWYLAQANGITPDGRFIVGTAIDPTGILQPFRLEFLYPEAPSDLSYAVIDLDGVAVVELNWTDNSTNEYNFHLQRKDITPEGSSEWMTIALTDSAVTQWLDESIILSEETDYKYRIRSENPVGNSAWESILVDIEFTPPAEPSELYSEIVSTDTLSYVYLAWLDNSDNESNFHIQRREITADGPGEWVTMAMTDPDVTEWIDESIVIQDGLNYRYRLRAENLYGSSSWLTILVTTSSESMGIPTEFRISNAYPNPFNPSTTISYEIPEEMQVNMTLFNLTGARVAEVMSENVEAGYYDLSLDLSTHGAGVYMLVIQGEGHRDVRKLTLIK